MAKKQGELNVKIKLSIDSFVKKLNRLDRKVNQFSQDLEKTGKFLTTRFSIPLAAAGVVALKTSAKFERLRVTMDVLTGSAEQGAKSYNELVEVSSKTPFRLEQLSKGFNILLGFGLAADDAMNATRRLGDMVALTGGNLNNVAIAFGQARAEGKVMTRDLRQLINQQIPIIELLEKELGKTSAEIFEMAETSRLGYDVVARAINNATNEGGKFYRGTERLADTLDGVWSTFRDNVDLAAKTFGDSIEKALGVKEVLKTMGGVLRVLANRFKSLDDSTKSWVVRLGVVAIAAGPLLLVLGQIPKLITAITAGMRVFSRVIQLIVSPKVILITALVAALAAIGIYLYKNWEIVKARFQNIWSGLKNIFLSGIQYIVGKLAEFDSWLGGVIPGVKEFNEWLQSIEPIKIIDPGEAQSFSEFMASVKKDLQDLQNAVLSPAGEIDDSFSSVGAGGGGAKKGSSGSGTNLLDYSKLIYPFVKLKNKMNEMKAEVITFSSELATNWSGLITNIMENAKNMANFMQGEWTKATVFIARNFDFIANLTMGVFTDVFDAIASGGEDVFKTLTRTIGALVKKLIVAAAAAFFLSSILGGFNITKIGSVKTSFEGLFNALSGIKFFAKGGITTGPTPAILGDNPSGREAVVPFERMGEFLKAAAPYVPNSGGGPVTFRILGKDLIGVLGMANDEYTMLGGSSIIP
jgi:tape measure domain-containing protein